MKYLQKIILATGLLLLLSFGNLFAEGVVKIPTVGIDKITAVSIEHVDGNGNIVESVNSLGFRILKVLKLIIQGLLVIYVVYIGITMIISMGTDEDKLSKSKNQLWYSLIALVFINIPGTIYSAISADSNNSVINDDGTIDFTGEGQTNLIVPGDGFNGVISSIVGFLEVFIFGVALFVMVMAGIKIMTSRGKEEKVTEAKNKILYSIFAMVFVGMIEAWKSLAITGKVKTGTDLFGNLLDLALLFAGPIVVFFLTLSGYYYITSNGDEDRIKKAKSIIINTIMAILILVVMFTFLNDLINL
ncbi:hypothetical protein LR004_02665 [Candidatus Gracilibacteria bacterium]|nr:hypothetical protein [Candidatus Gracilibacteria bacterium]